MPDGRSPFHRGEQALQSRLGVRDKVEKLGQRVIQDHIPQEQEEFFSNLPFLVVGSADDAGGLWASILVGQPGFMTASDPRTLAVTAEPVYGDPLIEALAEGAEIGALGIELHSRRRYRVNGRVVNKARDSFEIAVDQGFYNCPKYIQARRTSLEGGLEALGEERLTRRGEALNRAEAALIARSDTLFIASRFAEDRNDWSHGVDVSHRGGRPGFVIVAHETSLVFPDYRGNCMLNTLGNIWENPKCGLLFPDFESGDILQVTGEAEIIWGEERAKEFPGAERIVSFRIQETNFIENALPLSWEFQDYSPVFDEFEDITAPDHIAAAHEPMRLKSVQVSMPKQVEHNGKAVTTGIFKKPATGRIMLRRLNLDGDGQADLWGHGGTFRAVLAYSHENYAYWEHELDRHDFTIGQFGENFTVEGMLEDDVHVGDIFRIGEALVQVSQPRIPCYKLGIKMGIDGFENQFLASGRVGFYFRVLEEGEVGAGDAIKLVERDPRRMTVREVSNLLFFDKENLDATQKALSIQALSHGWKGSFEERLARGFRSFVVDRKVVESETITSFYLVPEDGARLPRFEPGQFLTFEINIPGRDEPLVRTYSLSDSPNPDYYRISIKREPAPAAQPELPTGLSSNYLHDHVDAGNKLCVKAPRGKFHLDGGSERAVVLLSAGVGLSPMISMLNTIVAAGSPRPVWYIHGARNGREHAMGLHVRALAREFDNLHVHIRYSRPEPADVEGRDYDSEGHVDIDLLKQLRRFDDFDFYLCGPTPFMQSLYRGLRSLSVPDAHIHYEFFGPAAVLKGEADRAKEAPGPAGEVDVTFSRSGVTVRWDPVFDNLLEFAEAQGLSPDFSCRSGICNTCKCALEDGEIEYLEEPLDDPGPDDALICSSRPKSNIVIGI